MTDSKIGAAIKLVATALEIPEDELGPDSSMENTPAWDSFEHMNICMLLEQRFDVKLNMDSIVSATSVRALANLMP